MDANIQADGQAKWCEWYAAAQSGDNGHNPRPMRRSAARDARAIPEWNRFTPHDREQICLNMHARQQIVNNFQARQQRMEDDADLADVARANGDFKRYMDINNDLVLRYRDMADNDLDPDGALGPSTRNIIQLVRPSVPSGDRVVNCINRLLNQWHIQMNAKANEHHGRALHPRLTPRHYNGVCKIHENWQVYFHELRRRVRRLDAFKDGDPYPQHPAAMIGAWMGAYILRRSDLANVGMWVWIVNGRVKDRAVRKDTYVDRASWSDVTMWQNIDYNSNGLRIPLEVVNLHRLTLGHGVQPPSVPRLRAWRVYRDAMMYSITYDYSPFGTMHDLVVRILHREPENRRYIPEPFLWRTISAIAQVGFAMHGLDPVTQVVDPVYLGKRIVHRNIALENVFLDAPHVVQWPSYPLPRLGQFGSSFQTHDGHDDNPDMFVDGGGAPGWLAPEMIAFINARTGDPVDRWKIDSHTNVFGLGLLLFAMMTLQPELEQPHYIGPNARMDDGWDIYSFPSANFYSRELRALVKGCLRPLPNDRLKWPDIMARLDAARDPNGLNLVDGTDLRLIHPNEANCLYYNRVDPYEIGRAAANLPPPPG